MSSGVHRGLAVGEEKQNGAWWECGADFPEIPGGFHVLPNVKNKTDSAFHTGWKGRIILPQLLFPARTESTKLQFI